MKKESREEKILAVDRLVLFIRAIDVSHFKFEQAIGVSNGYITKQLKRRGSISSKILTKILLRYPELNIIWLLTGHSVIIPRQELGKQNSNATLIAS